MVGTKLSEQRIGAKRRAPPREKRARGSAPAPERRRDLGVGQTSDVTQRKREPLTRRQLGKRLAHRWRSRPTLRKFSFPDRCDRMLRIQQSGKITLGPDSAPPRAKVAQSTSSGNSVNPRIEPRRVAEPPKSSEDVNRDVLRDICGVLP